MLRLFGHLFHCSIKMKPLGRALVAISLAVVVAIGFLWAYSGTYGLHLLIRHGGTYWLPVSRDSSRLSPSMRLALHTTAMPVPGQFQWHVISEGFDVAELPVLLDGKEVDRILLARIDPARFRFVVRNASSGDKNLDQWMAALGASLVVNGSYYSRYGTPDTPFLSNGVLLGPSEYDAKGGAFVSSPTFTGIRDLSHVDWKAAFGGANDAMVSYPLLLANGATHVARPSEWLANRSFVGQDETGWIIIGTTRDAFFSLDRLAHFLRDTSLRLTLALNLDGGPVACQGISLNGYERRTNGHWELQVNGQHAKLLTWPYGTVAMPVVLAVFPK